MQQMGGNHNYNLTYWISGEKSQVRMTGGLNLGGRAEMEKAGKLLEFGKGGHQKYEGEDM